MLQATATAKETSKDNVFTTLEKAVRECLPAVCNPSFSGIAPAIQGNQERVLEVRLGRNCSWKPDLLFKKIGATESEQKGNEHIFHGRLHGNDYTLRVISSQQARKSEDNVRRSPESERARMDAAESTKAGYSNVAAD